MKRPSKKTLVRDSQDLPVAVAASFPTAVRANKIYNICKHFPNEFALSIMRRLFIPLFGVIF